MAKKSDAVEASDPFQLPEVAAMWGDVTDITDDPTVAKDVIRHLSKAFWDLPWPVWQQLQSTE